MSIEPISLQCSQGFTLTASAGNIIIRKKNSEETVPIPRIQSFTMNEPRGGPFTVGTIVFRTAQAATAGVNLAFGITAALGAEKTFIFSKANLEIARQLRDYVTAHAGGAVAAQSIPETPNAIEDLRSLKSLMDDGIITQEEFDAKKKKLLGI